MAKGNRQAAAIEPSTRVLATWSPALIKSAEVMADAGSLRLAADLCEEIIADDRVNGVLTARTRGLLGLGIEFEKAGDKRRSGKAVKALEVGEDWWASFPESELAALSDWAVILGVGLAQNVWTERDNGRIVPRLSRYHPRWLRYDWQERGWFLTVANGTEERVVAGDGRWVLHTPSGGSRPWADGAWRSLSRLVLMKQYARQDWALHSEVHGQPIKVGIGIQGSTDAQRQELTQDLSDLGRDTAITLPPGWDLRLVEAKARTWDMFEAQITMANNAIAIRLAGQNLTTDVTGGSLAAAKVHQIIRGDLIRFDGQSLSTTLNEQSLAWWAEFNFGDRKLAPWPEWDTDPGEDQLVAANTRKAQAEAIAALRNAGVTLDSVLEEFGLKLDPAAAKVPVQSIPGMPNGQAPSKPNGQKQPLS